MFSISNRQMSEITQGQVSALCSRIDTWLASELDHWRQEKHAERLAWINETILLGQTHGMRSDMDFALLARILSEHRPGWRDFANAEPQRSVLTCEDRQNGAKIRELIFLSERSRYNRAEG